MILVEQNVAGTCGEPAIISAGMGMSESQSKFSKRKYESPRQLARQASILAATRELLAEQGYAGTTMRSLADRAGVVPGTLYNLFKSKDELVLAAMEDLLDDIGAQTVANSDAGLARLVLFSRKTATSIEDNPAFAEAMGRALFRGEADHPLTDLLIKRNSEFLVEQLAVAQQSGVVAANVDVERTANMINAQNWGVIMTWVMGVFTQAEVGDVYMEGVQTRLVSIVVPEHRAALAQLFA